MSIQVAVAFRSLAGTWAENFAGLGGLIAVVAALAWLVTLAVYPAHSRLRRALGV